MAKTEQGFSGNPRLEMLHFPDKTTFDAIEAYCHNYHANEIPSKYYQDGLYAVTLSNLAYVSKSGRKYTAKAGTVISGGSVPKFMWDSVSAPYASKYLPAYVLHDYVCGHARDIDDKYLRRSMRNDADVLFKEMVAFLGAGWIMRNVFHKGVRIGAFWDEVTR